MTERLCYDCYRSDGHTQYRSPAVLVSGTCTRCRETNVLVSEPPTVSVSLIRDALGWSEGSIEQCLGEIKRLRCLNGDH